MSLGPNPLTAEAARRALVENDRLDARANDSNASRASLDAEELRDLERSLYYDVTAAPANTEAAAATDPATVTPPARRSLIARLFRR